MTPVIQDTTLVCVDCVSLDGAIKAIEESLLECSFTEVKLLTCLETNYKYAIKIKQIKSLEEYSIFIIKDLYKYINTKHFLLIQADGWVIDGSKWKDYFYNYDYIGGACNWMDPTDNKGGNGGFSFRSKSLMEKAASHIPVALCHPEDVSISSKYRNKHINNIIANGFRDDFESMGFNFADYTVEKFFSNDDGIYKDTFGHHKGNILKLRELISIKRNSSAKLTGKYSNINIISALYGSENFSIDVTDLIREKIHEKIVVSNTFFDNDPHFSRKKFLKIDFSIDNAGLTQYYNESLIIDCLGESLEKSINYSRTSPKVYDCFMFFNELELLDVRLNELYDKVEKFIIIEANRTHSGLDKESIFLKNISKYEKFLPKIVHKIVNLDKDVDPYKNECLQRNFIIQVLSELKINNNDIILISDCDEIPDIVHMRKNSHISITNKIIGLNQKKYNYKINLLETTKWNYSFFCTYNNLPEDLNKSRFGDKDIYIDCGWHFSYLGGEEKIIEKIKSFHHQEFNNEKSLENIMKCYERRVFFVGNIQMKKVVVDDTFPRYIREHMDIYSKFID